MTLAEFVDEFPDAVVAAFAGRQVDRVVEDELADAGAILEFEVESVFIGDVGMMHEVRTHAQTSACGLDVVGSGTLGILVTDFGRGPSVDQCGSLWRVDDLTAEFGPGRTPTAESSTTSTITTTPTTTTVTTSTTVIVDDSKPDRSDDRGGDPSAVKRAGLAVLLFAIGAAGVGLAWRGRRR